MKRLGFIVCLLLLFAYCAQAQERVIERPAFLAWSSPTIEIDKIVQNQEATTLHIKAYYRPKYWINVPKETYLIAEDGEKYQITSSDGINIDEKFFMPESGEAEFSLVFPPLPASVNTVDFIEDVENGFKVWGIQLSSKEMPKPDVPKNIAKSKINKKATLPPMEFKMGKATLKGKLLGYRPNTFSSISFFVGNPLRMGQVEEIKINDDGTFSTEIDAISPMSCWAYIGSESVRFFLAPGEETILYPNIPELYRMQSKLRKDEKSLGKIAYFDGYMAGIAEECNEHHVIFKGDRNILNDIRDKDMDGVKEYFFAKHEEKMNKIKSLKASEACKQIMTSHVNGMTAMEVINAAGYLVRSLRESGKVNNEDWPSLAVSEDYYSELKQLSGLNTPAGIYATSYSMLLNNPKFKEEFSKAIGTNKGTYFELAKANSILKKIDEFKPLTDEDRVELAAFPSPVFLELGEENNRKLLATIEANKKKTGFTINEAGEISNEDLFASIISKFSGKVILVDFWATWCGPCRMANKEMAPMKKELEGQDIVYLYIAGENSPLATWENMIPDIHGEHYRVTAGQWKYLGDTFKIEGVPTYLIVDKEGNVSFKTTGYPGVEKMKAELMKVVNGSSQASR